MLTIPTVTQDDLYTFHAHVFGTRAPSAILLLTGKEHANVSTHGYDDQDEEDNLGYYPDGNKRTLTDDQIVMFRHSEIYSILRERQVRKENTEADGDDQSKGKVSDVEEAPRAPLLPDNEEKAQLDGDGDGDGDGGAAAEEDMGPKITATSSNKRRKRHRTDLGDTREPTHRRLARELDSVIADGQTLDYGDEPSAFGEINANQLELRGEAAASIAEKNTSGIDDSDQARKSAAEGKKIWWPVLGM